MATQCGQAWARAVNWQAGGGHDAWEHGRDPWSSNAGHQMGDGHGQQMGDGQSYMGDGQLYTPTH
eukprot:12792487-Heterocapsa_arctica.AAC.1